MPPPPPSPPPSPTAHDTSRLVRAVSLVRAGWRDLVGLVVPVACAGCGRPDVPWCAACGATLRGPVARREHGAGRLDRLDGGTLLPVWAPAEFAGPVRHALSAWKDGGRRDLDRPLAAAMRRAGRAVAAHVPAVRAAPDGAGVLVVPVPSTGGARRRRGRAPVDVLAAAVAAGLRDAGVIAVTGRVLRRSGGPDLAGLTAGERGPALAGRVHARRPVGGRPVLLVDDVLTTGATLAACCDALAAAGAHAVGAVTVAATAPPGAAAVTFVRTEQRVVHAGPEQG